MLDRTGYEGARSEVSHQHIGTYRAEGVVGLKNVGCGEWHTTDTTDRGRPAPYADTNEAPATSGVFQRTRRSDSTGDGAVIQRVDDGIEYRCGHPCRSPLASSGPSGYTDYAYEGRGVTRH